MSFATGHTIDLVEIATQVAEAAAGIASIITAFKTLSLARKYYELYKHQREWYYTVFQEGLENPLAAEVYADTPYAISYLGRIASAHDANTGPFGGRSTDTAAWWARHGGVYGTANDLRLTKELQFDTARIKTDWANYLFRFEEQFYDTSHDIRFRKRMMLHNIGLKQGTTVAAALDSALDQYVSHISDFGDQLATYGNGIAKYAGYKRGMADTADDFKRMEFSQRVPQFNYADKLDKTNVRKAA